MTPQPKRIAVTGATGFVGRNLVQELLSKGYEVHAFGRKPVEGTIFHQWEATSECPEYGISFHAVVHCAASATDWGDDTEISAVNIKGTESALKIDAEARFIHVSTASVYAGKGDAYNLVENETTSAPFMNAYIESKLVSEEVVHSDPRNSGLFILRPHAIYGPGDTTLLPRVEDAIRGKFLPLPGAGRSLVSLTRVEGLVSVILNFIDYEGTRTHGIFNVADKEPVILGDALQTILRNRGKETRIISIPSSLAWVIGGILEKVSKTFHLARPPITRYLVSQLGYAETLSTEKLESFLGRSLPVSNFDDAGKW